jgi:hypothetical protein
MLVPQEASEGARKIVNKVMPQYPGLARAANIQGVVKADVIVAATGKVQSIEVRGGHPASSSGPGCIKAMEVGICCSRNPRDNRDPV